MTDRELEEDRIKALEDLISHGTPKSKEDFYRDVEVLLHDLSGLCIDQLELICNCKENKTENREAFETARRIILNRLNQHTKLGIKRLLRTRSLITIIEEQTVIKFSKPIHASGIRPRIGDKDK